MEWKKLDFGKYKGKSFPQIAFIDPDYIYWLLETHAFMNDPILYQQAKEVALKARRVRGNVREGWPEDMIAYHELCFPRPFGEYKDNRRNRRLKLKPIVVNLFGENARMTKQVCEPFFEDSANFYMDLLVHGE